LEIKTMQIKVISQFHPAAALHQPRLWASMLNDWEHLPEEVPHDFKIVPWEVLEEYIGS